MPFVIASCATKEPPAMPATLRHPEFIYPVVPDALKWAQAERVEYGWRFLQSNDLGNAEREFSAVLAGTPTMYPAQTGAAYVALAARDHEEALAHFERALKLAPKYVPALVGKGQTLLALKRDEDALEAFEAALAAEPSLEDVRRRIEVLRFRSAQDVVEAARAAAKAGRFEEARLAYRRALDGSPDTAFLHRELGVVERGLGNADAALTELRKAVELDPSDAASLIQIGELLEARMDFTGAETAYRAAAAIEPSDALTARIEDMAEKERVSKLPPEFRAIPDSPQITRGELAALIGIRLEHLLKSVPPRQVVITDVRNYWAAPWVTDVARAGILEPFPNHTFQPRTRVRRGDLAAAVSRLVILATPDEARREEWSKARPKIADMSPGHLSYPAVAVAVASGVMPLEDGDRFGVTRPVSGTEALQVVDRIVALSRGSH